MSKVDTATGKALKPSLVEWKQIEELPDRIGESTLKPSLVEWKLEDAVPMAWARHDLETFLGGMETIRETRVLLRRHKALKPSLVEWKQMSRVRDWLNSNP